VRIRGEWTVSGSYPNEGFKKAKTDLRVPPYYENLRDKGTDILTQEIKKSNTQHDKLLSPRRLCEKNSYE
jgi:hypothetical protein